MGMLNAAKSTMAASAIATCDRFEESFDDEGAAVRGAGGEGSERMNGTYPMDLRPCTLVWGLVYGTSGEVESGLLVSLEIVGELVLLTKRYTR